MSPAWWPEAEWHMRIAMLWGIEQVCRSRTRKVPDDKVEAWQNAYHACRRARLAVELALEGDVGRGVYSAPGRV